MCELVTNPSHACMTHHASIVLLYILLSIFTPVAYAQDVSVPHATTISSVVNDDTHITNIALSSTSVSISYPVHARLFGIFPATLLAAAQVNAGGSIDLRYPWYRFLFSTNQTTIETTLRTIGGVANQYDTPTLSADQQLTLLSLMHAAFESNYTATSSVVQ